MSITTRFENTLSKAHKKYGVRVTSKDKELKWLWLIIDKFLKIVTFGKMNTFLTNYTTTLGRTIYYPFGWNINKVDEGDYVVLNHEIKHVKQALSLCPSCPTVGILLFSILYLFIPLPIGFAYFRWKFEREAYRVSWYTWLELGRKPKLDFYIEQMTGPNYLWTWMIKSQVRLWFTQHCLINAPLTKE